MPSFHEHISHALPIAAISGLLTFVFLMDVDGYGLWPSLSIGATGAAVVLFGAMLPDVDHHASIPRKWLGAFGGLLLMLGWVLGTIYISAFMDMYFDSFLVGGLVMVICIYLALIFLTPLLNTIGSIFDSLLTHRGFTHSVFFIVLAAAGVYFLADPVLEAVGIVEDSLPLILGALIGLGILLHMTADGMSMEDLLG